LETVWQSRRDLFAGALEKVEALCRNAVAFQALEKLK